MSLILSTIISFDVLNSTVSASELEGGFFRSEKSEVSEEIISSTDMEVYVDRDFPRVIKYVKNGKVIYGQEEKINNIKINGNEYTPKVTSEVSKEKISYFLDIKEIDIKIDMEFVVNDSILEMKVTNIDDENGTYVKSLEFPKQNLISVKESQPGSYMAYNANYLGGDVFSTVKDKAIEAEQKNGHVILNTDELAAAIEVGVSSQNVYVETKQTEDGKITGAWPYTYLYRGPDNMTMELPWAKVVITEDRNEDEYIDWQDGAIAYRDIQDLMPGDKAIAQETIFVNIPLNYRGRLPWTWENMLDMLKRQAAATDNFPQAILIKNIEDVNMIPGFGNANQRLGGVEKFNWFVEEASKLNINIGGHVDTNLAYANSPLFGGTPLSSSYGIAWDLLNREGKSIDTTDYWSAGVLNEGTINEKEFGRYGLLGSRYDLQAETYPELDFLYVDVELGKTNGPLAKDAKWHAYNVVQKFKEHGWNLFTEYQTGSLASHADDYRDSIATKYVTWSHVWPGTGSSNIRRFIMNHQSIMGVGDSNYQNVLGTIPTGEGKNGMTHGYMGWVDNGNPKTLTECLDEFWSRYLPVTYLKNFEVLKVGEDENNNNKLTAWLTDNVKSIYEDNFQHIYKDEKLIAKVNNNSTTAANEIFIPWSPTDEEKIYTKFTMGGNKTWDLPETWSDLETVMLYRLDQSNGRIFEKEIKVINNQVSIDYAENEGYVLLKGESKDEPLEWGIGSSIKDFEFNSGDFRFWNKEGNANITIEEDNETLNRYLRIEGNEFGSTTQILSGLEPNKDYVITALTKSEDNKEAVMKIESNGESFTSSLDYPVEAETDRKNMGWPMLRVYFRTGDDGTAKLTLAGNTSEGGAVNFDDLRLNQEENPYGKDGHYYYDDINDSHWLGSFMHKNFRTIAAVSYFNNYDINGNPNSITHSIDTIEEEVGERSIRVMGWDGNKNLMQGQIIKTLPSLLKFEPNKSYELSIDYKPLYSTGDKWSVALFTSESGVEFLEESLTGFDKQVSTYKVKFNTGDFDDVAFAIKHTGISGGDNIAIDNIKVDEIPYDETLPTPEETSKEDSNNIALNKQVFVSSTEGNGNIQSRLPSNAVDGKNDTMWGAATRDTNQWLTVDLGDLYEISKTSILFEKATNWKYKIDISDDNENWKTIYDGGNDNRTTNERIDAFEKDKAIGRYLRVSIIGLTTEFPLAHPQIQELRIVGEIATNGDNVALNKQVSASSVEGNGNIQSRLASNAVDGNESTMWGAGTRDINQWLTVDLGEEYLIKKSELLFEKETDWKYKIEASLDNSNWEIIYDGSNDTRKDKLRINSFPESKIRARYIKVSIIGLSSEFPLANPQIQELRVFGEKIGDMKPNGKPSDLRTTDIKNNSVTLAWNSPENTYGIDGYIIYKDNKKIGEVLVNEIEFKVENLKRHTIYNFKVAAKYSNGEISEKDTITVRTSR